MTENLSANELTYRLKWAENMIVSSFVFFETLPQIRMLRYVVILWRW